MPFGGAILRRLELHVVGVGQQVLVELDELERVFATPGKFKDSQSREDEWQLTFSSAFEFPGNC